MIGGDAVPEDRRSTATKAMAQRFQYSLKKMLAAATLFAIWCALVGWMVRYQGRGGPAIALAPFAAIFLPAFAWGYLKKDAPTGCLYGLLVLATVILVLTLVARYR